MDAVSLLDRGHIPYPEGVDIQLEHHARVSAGEQDNTLLLLEHTSVYTGGRMAEHSEVLDPSIDVVETTRGGKITWHGPGQLIGYPIYRLPNPINVVGYVRTLEQMLIEVLGDFGITATQVPKRTGVWVGPEGAEEKIAAIGIRIADRTTMHGFALNVSNSLGPFESIVACGIEDAGITTMTHQLGRQVSVSDVAQNVSQTIGRYFP
jgi:lipoate-protein ligase B